MDHLVAAAIAIIDHVDGGLPLDVPVVPVPAHLVDQLREALWQDAPPDNGGVPVWQHP